MEPKPQSKLFLVRLTAHLTYEQEVLAETAVQAECLGARAYAEKGSAPFTLVESDLTDWDAIELEPTRHVASAAAIEGAPAGAATVTARHLTPVELATIARLLVEVRESTLSRKSYDQATAMIEAITGQHS